MKRNKLICGTSLVLTAALVLCTACQSGSVNTIALQTGTDSRLSAELSDTTAQDSANTAAEKLVQEGKKNETVYVNLYPDGKPRETIVSDWIHSEQAAGGGARLNDQTNLSDISVLKGGSLVSDQNGELVWQMEGQDLYYQGSSQRELPLTVSIGYLLDGQEYAPEELAGRSGRLTIRIALKNNLCRVVSISGRSVDMYAPLTAVLGLILPDDVFSNVAVSDGKVVSDGNNQVVAIVAMPGLAESLNIDAYDIPGIEEINIPEEFTVTADVENFEMGPIAIAASTGFPEVDTDSSEIDDMYNNLLDLQGMQNSIENADPNHQVRSIYTDPQMTKGAQILVDDIYVFYDMDKKLLNMLPHFVTDGNVNLLKRLHKKTEKYDLDQLIASYTADTLFNFADEFELEKAKLLLGDANSALHLAKQLEDLAKNPATAKALAGAAELGLVAQENPRETAALSAVAGNLTPEAISGLVEHYKASGLENLDLNQLSAVMNFYESSGLADNPQLLSSAMTEIGKVIQQKGGPLSAEEWQTFLIGGLSALSGNGQTLGLTPAQPAAPSVDSTTGGETPAQPVAPSGDSTTGSETPAQPAAPSGDSTTGSEDKTATQDGVVTSLSVKQPAAFVSLNTGAAVKVRLLAANEEEVTATKADSLNMEELKALLSELEAVKTSTIRTLTGYGIDVTDKQAMGKLFATGSSIATAAGHTIMPMAALQQDAKAYAQLGQLLTMMQDGTLGGMKNQIMGHLAQNQKNVALLQTMLTDPKLNFTPYLNFIENSGDLRNDLRDALCLVDDLNVKMSRKGMDDSLADAPEMVETLMKMKNDLEEYRKVSDALKVAVGPSAVTSFNSVFSTLDRLESEGAVDRYVGQVDNLRDLLKRKDAYVELAKQNTIFTAAPDDLETELKFIMKTDEIKIPAAEPDSSTEKTTEKGLLDKVKNIVKK